MPILTRNASKKQKLEPSSSQEPQNSQKVPQKRMKIWGRGAKAAVSADAAHEAPKLTGTDPRNRTTKVEARILPLAAAASLPLTSVSSTTPMAPITKPLKGHKRFSADLRELKTGRSSDLDRGIWSVQSFRSGEDDGSVEFELVDSRDQIRIVVYLLCSDTSEYPSTHSFFCHSPDPRNYREQMQEICDEVLSIQPSTIREVAKHFLIRISCDEDEDDDEDDHDEDIAINESIVSLKPEISRSALRRDFEGAYAAGYTPGIIWSSSSEFILTVSVPVVELTEKIPAHALMSWDSQFLLPCQHLVLVMTGFRGVYPPIRSDGTLTTTALCSGASLKFNVGFSRKYKPSKEHVSASLRQYGLQLNQSDLKNELAEDYIDVDEEFDNNTFDKTSLSSSLESLFDEHFLPLLRLRQEFKLGWAAAEELHWNSRALQESPAHVVTKMQEELWQIDEEEQRLAASRNLPHDPLESQDGRINLLETAFAYFLRRLTLCSRYCVVCHKKIDTDFEALKPYVCNSGLCAYQYYSLNFGPSLEYDICKNTEMVDLLVSLAYSAAAGGALDEPLPRGLSLKVPNLNPTTGELTDNSLRDFDTLDITEMRLVIKYLIDALPPIKDMKKHLEKRVSAGTNRPKLKDFDPDILPAAWSILRWCVASCTAHLQELTEEEDLVQNISSEWRQFRFTVGAPDKEAKFRDALEKETTGDANAKRYPTLYAFHGSPLRNWHSIIRHGLWYKTIAHGRSYGNGVYFAHDGTTSTGYAAASGACWPNSTTCPTICVALAEIINVPHKFTSSSPYYVVQNTEWIMCRYLLVKNINDPVHTTVVIPKLKELPKVPFMVHDSKRQPLLGGAKVEIPQPSYKLQKLLALCKKEYTPPYLDDEDRAVFNAPIET
ncbi:hypothetical protein M405DRAFT_587353 [Rhizopogon salebrosus TDB-379]|nr:hypothetical protein M405DRAFT_587353 [Rhizopogon salebrosus TDB-379]